MTRRRIFECALLVATVFCCGCGGHGPAVGPVAASPAMPPAAALPLTITAPDAFVLVESNKTNRDFVILDVRTPGEFASGYIAGAIEIDYYSPDFRSIVGSLNTGRRYLVYCQSGARGAAAAQMMEDLAFKQVQNLTGGLDEWLQGGYPITRPPVTVPLPVAITTLDAFALVQSNRTNADFVILDVRTAGEFASGHIAGAVNIDYYSADFRSTIRALNADKRYLVYCRTGVRGAAATQMLADLGFMRAQNLTGGLNQWTLEGYPTVS